MRLQRISKSEFEANGMFVSFLNKKIIILFKKDYFIFTGFKSFRIKIPLFKINHIYKQYYTV